MQFYASVARKPGSRRAKTSIITSQKPALDIKSSAFSTPEEEEEEECRGKKGQLWIALHLLLYLCCTGN